MTLSELIVLFLFLASIKIFANSLFKNKKKSYKKYNKKYSDNNKYNYKKIYESNKRKGNEYEIQIGKLFEEKGFDVEYRGIKLNKKDKGIDLIAKKNNTICLIQCKNWETRKIKQRDLKEFLFNCDEYIRNNVIDKTFIKRFFITSNMNEIDKGVKYFLEEHKNKLEIKQISYKF